MSIDIVRKEFQVLILAISFFLQHMENADKFSTNMYDVCEIDQILNESASLNSRI